MAKTIKLFNALANEMQDAELTHINNEWVATFADEHFWKYPFTEDMELLGAAITAHNEHNKPVITTAMVDAENARREALLDAL